MPESIAALGICLEEYRYPYAVRYFPLTCDLQPLPGPPTAGPCPSLA